jgi:hypothetical protein
VSNFARLALAGLWSCIWIPVVLLAAGFAMMGDCASPADVCFQGQQVIGWAVIGVGALVLLFVYFFIFRFRRG